MSRTDWNDLYTTEGLDVAHEQLLAPVPASQDFTQPDTARLLGCGEAVIDDAPPLGVSPENKIATGSFFKLVSAESLTSEPRAPEWVVKPLFEANTINSIIGDPATLKSFLVADIGLSCSAGIPWHGHKTKQGLVINVNAEGFTGKARRVKAWGIYREVELSDAQYYVSECSAQLLDIESAVEVTAAIQNIVDQCGENPVLIIIDTMSRNFGPGNESSAEDMGQFINHIDIYLRQRFGAAILIVHHTGHMDKNRPRGSSVFTAAMDSEYKVERLSGELIQLTNKKMKDAEEPEPITFKAVEVELPWLDDEGIPLSSLVLELSDEMPAHEAKGLGRKQQQLLDLLRTLHGDNCKEVTIKQWKDQAIDDGLLTGSYVRQDFQKVKNSLHKRGLIEIEGIYVCINE